MLRPGVLEVKRRPHPLLVRAGSPKGARPETLPVEQATKVQLVLDL